MIGIRLLTVVPYRLGEETEEGELEAGELCEDGDSATNFKRARLAVA